MSVTSAGSASRSRPARRWSPRFLQGTDTITWAKLLWRSRFAVHPRYWYIAAIVSVVSTMNLALRWLQNGLYAEELRRTRIDRHPVFVLGHWRSGTTLLHELLIQDEQFNYPDFFACFNPNHHLLSERFFKTYLNILAPERRPMDNMAVGWDRPQEDEFALCLLGSPSPYADIAFPNSPPIYPGSLDLSGLTPGDLARWKRTFYHFLRSVSFRDSRRLVLKSPPHTARVPVLMELFPDARFVHIVRDPFVVFASTVNLWNSMAARHGLQVPRGRGVEAKVLREYRILFERLEAARPLFKPGRFHELRYEDLVADPLGELEKTYRALELDGFDAARPRVEAYLSQTRGYETNRYQITPEQRGRLLEAWGDIIRRYGYG